MSLEDKVNKFISKKKNKKILESIVLSQPNIDDIANDVLSIMKDAVNSAAQSAKYDGVPQSVFDEIDGLSISSAIGSIKDGQLKVDINLDFPEGTRPSLDSEQDGVNDIIALINNGYQVKKKNKYGYQSQVYGEWHGKKIWSNPNRLRTDFLDDAVSLFEKTASSTYSNPTATLNKKYK